MSDSERILADFMGIFTIEGTYESKPVDGRVLLGPEQLVLVGPDGKTNLALSEVVDVGVGRVPPEYEQYFDDSIMVAFATEGAPRVATIEAGKDTIDRFGMLLFKTQLHETAIQLNHPARLGGRVTDGGFAPATLYLGNDSVTFGDIGTPFRISLDAVIGFGRPERTVEGNSQTVISIRHLQSGQTMTSEINIKPKRQANLLGRYLRMQYQNRRSEVNDLDLSATEKELLVALHSGAGAGDLAGVLEVDPGQVSMHLNELEGDGLLETEAEGVSLTSTGRIALEKHLEEINK